MYLKKIEDGSLEIRKTLENHHAKVYLLHNKSEISNRGDFPGTVFMGSSNFTYRGLKGQGELIAINLVLQVAHSWWVCITGCDRRSLDTAT